MLSILYQMLTVVCSHINLWVCRIWGLMWKTPVVIITPSSLPSFHPFKEVSSSEPLVIMMSFLSRRDVSRWVRTSNSTCVKAALERDESRQNLSKDDTGANKHSTNNLYCDIFISSFGPNCPHPVWINSIPLNHKIECLWWIVNSGVLIGKSLYDQPTHPI